MIHHKSYSVLVSVPIHDILIFLVNPGNHSAHSFLIGQVPVNRIHNPDLKRRLRIPSQVRSLVFGRIILVPPVMAQSVLHMSDQFLIDSLVPQPVMQLLDNGLILSLSMKPLINAIFSVAEIVLSCLDCIISTNSAHVFSFLKSIALALLCIDIFKQRNHFLYQSWIIIHS